MDRRDYLAGMHRSVIDEFIQSVVDQWAWDPSVLEQNVLGKALRSELESRLVPGLTSVLALLLEADARELGSVLPEWLDLTSSVMPAESAFLTEMGRRVDPVGAVLLGENSGLTAGESLAVREFNDFLWSVAPKMKRPG